MPPLVVTGAALVTLRWNNGGQPMANVMAAAILPTTIVGQALANALDTGIKAAFTASQATHASNNCQLLSVGVRDLSTANLAEYVGAGAPVAGTSVAEYYSRQVALCITLRTSRSGQRFRGRVYLGGYTEAAIDATGNFGTGVAAAGVAFITAIGGAMTTNGLALAVLSRPAERVVVETTTFHADGSTDVQTETRAARTGAITQVISIEARNSVPDTQRRRTGSGGVAALIEQGARLELPPAA